MSERPACRAAIIQALRFHFHLRPKEIAAILQIRSQTVSMYTGQSGLTIWSWQERRFQREAIRAAELILKAEMN